MKSFKEEIMVLRLCKFNEQQRKDPKGFGACNWILPFLG
jgi:hypothetical protein